MSLLQQLQHTAVSAERPAGESRLTATADSSTQPSQLRDLQERAVTQERVSTADSCTQSRHSCERLQERDVSLLQ